MAGKPVKTSHMGIFAVRCWYVFFCLFVLTVPDDTLQVTFCTWLLSAADRWVCVHGAAQGHVSKHVGIRVSEELDVVVEALVGGVGLFQTVLQVLQLTLVKLLRLCVTNQSFFNTDHFHRWSREQHVRNEDSTSSLLRRSWLIWVLLLLSWDSRSMILAWWENSLVATRSLVSDT